MHISRFFVAAGLSLFSSSLWAQTPAIQSPQIVVSGGTVSVNAGIVTNEARLQLRDGTATLSEKTLKDNASSAPLVLQGDPGAYTLQFAQNDKARTPIGAATPVIVPGVRREYGTWTFNGSLLVPIAFEETYAVGIPKFLPNLKRDAKTKLPQSTATAAIQEWATVPVDEAEMVGKPDTFTLPPLAQKLPKSGYFVGYELSYADRVSVKAVQRLRTLIDAQSPGAALILSVNAYDSTNRVTRTLNLLANHCDAIKINTTKDSPTATSFKQQLWVIKVARRIAEERDNYDLPIFVSQFDIFGAFSPSQALELFQSGATGIIIAPAQSESLAPIEALWRRNSNWLTGAVTLEDAAILPDAENKSLVFLDKLRGASRIPLLGRTPSFEKSRPEAVLTIVDDKTDEATLTGLKTSAESGQTVYVEGLPAQSFWKMWGDATKTQIVALDKPKEEQLRLDDIWFFGAQNGSDFRVTQRAKIEIKPDLASQANEKKGEARETKTRPIANLSADPNGILMCPVGKGRILWAPHEWLLGASPKAPYYAAISGAMQPALVDVKLSDGQSIEGKNVRLALRLSTAKTILFSAFNDGLNPLDLTATVRDAAGVVWDLKADKEVPSSVRGNGTTLQFTVPAGDFAYYALYDSKADFEKERKTARLKAKLK